MPQVQGVSRTPTAFAQNTTDVTFKPRTHLSDTSTLARYNQNTRARESSSSGGTIASCLKWIAAILIACVTFKWCFGKKDERKTEQSVKPQPSTTPGTQDKPKANNQKAVAVRNLEAEKAIAEAVRKGEARAQQHIRLARTENEPMLTGDNYGAVLSRKGKAVTLLMKDISDQREKYVTFHTYATHYLNSANDYLKQEVEKLRQDQAHDVDGAVVNLLRTAYSFMLDSSLHFEDDRRRDFVLLDQHKELHAKYGAINASDIFCVKTLELCEQSYETFREAVGLNAQDSARWQKLQTTQLGYIDELFKEKLLILGQKKNKAIADDFKTPLDRLSDTSGFKPEQIPLSLRKEEGKA